MNFKKIFFLATLIMSAAPNSSNALCFLIEPFWHIDNSKFMGGTDPSIVFKITTKPEGSFEDTIHQSDFLSDIKNSYPNSANVIIASVSKIKNYESVPDALGKFAYMESVTVKIESVLKGTMIPQDRIFTAIIPGISGRYIRDSITGENRLSVMQMSSSDKKFASVIGIRFLLFLPNAVNDSGNVGIEPLLRCESYYNKFIVDKNDSVYFDNYVVDMENKQVKRTPLLKVDLIKVQQSFAATPVVKKEIYGSKTVQRDRAFSTFNLLGRQVSGFSSTIRYHSANFYICNTQNNINRVFTVTAQQKNNKK